MPPPGTAGRIEAHDPIEHQEADDQFDVLFRQMTPGAFHSQTEYVQVNGILFYREHWAPNVISTGMTPEGYFIFGGTLSSPSGKSVDWCGVDANREQLAFGLPASEINIIFPQETWHIALLVPYHLMQHYFGDELIAYTLTSKSYHLQCKPQQDSNLLARLNHMVSKYQANPILLTDTLECNAVELQLMDDLADYFVNFHTKANHPPSSQRRKLLHRAINYAENLSGKITVPEFALANGMSQRSLELTFQET